MKLIMHLNIIDKTPGNTHVHTTVSKEYETDLVPMVGMEIEDSGFKKAREIRAITINPSEGYYFVYVGEDEQSNRERCESAKDMYVGHGWKNP